MTTNVKKLRNDVFLVSWSEATFAATKTVSVNLNDVGDASIAAAHTTPMTIKYAGYGTVKFDLELSNLLPSGTKNICSEEKLPEIYAKRNGTDGQWMNPVKGTQGQWLWNASWVTTGITGMPLTHIIHNVTCMYCCPISHTCQSCGLNQIRPAFSVDILIDFKDGSAYIKEGEKNVLGYLTKLLNDSSLADVTFQLKNEAIKAHSIIVSAGSPVLSVMFTQDFVESRTRVVEIKDTKPQVFKQLLHYIYTGKAPEIEREGMAHDLLVAADKYGVESLKEECANGLIKNLKVENASRTLITAHLHSSSKLHESTLSFMSQHGKAICSRPDWMDLIKTYPELCFQATQLMMGF